MLPMPSPRKVPCLHYINATLHTQSILHDKNNKATCCSSVNGICIIVAYSVIYSFNLRMVDQQILIILAGFYNQTW